MKAVVPARLLGSATASIFVCFLGSITSAQAFQSLSSDILVRTRAPQNTAAQASSATKAMLASSIGKKISAQSVDLVNAEEGLIKLSFSSQAEASRAIEALSKSEDVLNTSPDFLYTPALHLQARDLDAAQNPSYLEFSPFLNFESVLDTLQGQLPNVNPAPTHVVSGADPEAANDWALANIHMPSVDELSQTFGGNLAPKNITAVIDTGIDYNHEDLSGALWRKADTGEVGYDFVHNNTQPFDFVRFDIAGCLKDKAYCKKHQAKFISNPGHGTHCAGHVGAVANNSTGIRGIGTVTQIMGLKTFYDPDDANAGHADDSAAIRAIDYAIKNGAKIISASWGGRMARILGEHSELRNAFKRAQEAGVIAVLAAGNDGIDQDGTQFPDYPAAFDLDNIITVAATDSKDGLADFSNYGAKSVHVGAPGVKILSTTVGSKYSDVVARYVDPKTGADKAFQWDGTSMATPIVAGAVALVWAKFPQENYHQIRDRILNSVRHVPSLAGKTVTGGVIDVAAALKP